MTASYNQDRSSPPDLPQGSGGLFSRKLSRFIDGQNLYRHTYGSVDGIEDAKVSQGGTRYEC